MTPEEFAEKLGTTIDVESRLARAKVIAAAIRRAVLEEREACAKACELEDAGGGLVSRATAQLCAERIRGRRGE